VEIGFRSGVVVTALAEALNSAANCIGVDINPHACRPTKANAETNKAHVDTINSNLLYNFRKRSIDVLVFNPPYVATKDIFKTTITGDLVANLLIDLADIEVSRRSIFLRNFTFNLIFFYVLNKADCDDPLPMPSKICDHCQHMLVQACSLCKQIRQSDNALRNMATDIVLQPVEVSLNDQELYNAVIHVSEESTTESFVEDATPSPNIEEVILCCTTSTTGIFNLLIEKINNLDELLVGFIVNIKMFWVFNKYATQMVFLYLNNKFMRV
jgi:Methyltransferase small domain